MTAARPEISAIDDAQVAQVAEYFHARLNGRVTPQAWRAVLQPPWGAEGPNRGFVLRVGGRIVGAYAAVYSGRGERFGGARICNLAAFAVDDDHRAHALRLVRALLAQPGFVFTDLSPSGNVPAMNDRFGFARLDVRTRLTLNTGLGRSAGTVLTAAEDVRSALDPSDRTIFDDHRLAAAARHLVVVEADGRYAYLVYRRDRRRRLPVFATPLYVGGDAGVLERSWPAVARRLLATGHLVTLAEERVLRFAPRGPGAVLSRPRPRMVKNASDEELARVDYLYSELTLLEW